MATVPFHGEDFELAEGGPSEFALMEYALAVTEGQDGDTSQGMASTLMLVKDCLADGEWPRFRKLARKERAGVLELAEIIKAAMEQLTERPTGASSDSSDGRTVPATEPPSELSFADKAIAANPGRPDRAIALIRASKATEPVSA